MRPELDVTSRHRRQGRSALCPVVPRDDDAVVPYQFTELVSGVVLMTALIGAAALLGRLAAGLFLRATRPADAHEVRR